MICKIGRHFAALSLVLTTGLVAGLPANAQTPRTQPSQISQNATLLAGNLGFTVRGVRPSRSRAGGISRGEASCPCSVSNTPTALLPRVTPETTANEQIDVESTVSARPTFFVYLPQTQPYSAEFLLLNEAGEQIVYETSFTLPGTPGVIGIQLPADAPPLEEGKQYQWSLSVICDPSDRMSDLFVQGWVERTALSPALAAQLARTAPRNRPAFYARQGIWQDALASLAELRYTRPDDSNLISDWVSLLESVNLQAVAQEPLVQLATAQGQTAQGQTPQGQ